MKNWMKASVVVVAMASVLSFAACTPKKQNANVVKTERVVVEKPMVSLDSLDKRVSSLERSRAQLRKSFPVVAK